MARPIEQTPIIGGEDALRFKKSLFKSLTMSYSPEELERQKQELQEMQKSYQKIIAITNCTF